MTTSAINLSFDIWNGISKEAPEPLGGNSYEIRSAAQLAGLAELVNSSAGSYRTGSYFLEGNIDLNGHNYEWTPIGNDEHPFNGTFDGQGYTIRNLKKINNLSNVGLFGQVVGISSTSEIIDLNIEAVSINITSSAVIANAGTLAGYIEKYKIEHVFISGTFTVSSSVTSSHLCAGGIAGRIKDPATCILDSVSKINLTVKSTGNKAYAGGIVGKNGIDAANSGGIIENCYTIGNLTATSTFDSPTSDQGAAHSGGIAGDNHGSIQYCYAIVNIEATSLHNVAFAGGIAGWCDTGPIAECYAMGNVTATTQAPTSYIYKLSHAGGIVGCITDTSDPTIEKCAALNGIIKSTATVVGDAYAGRIVSRNAPGTFINNVANTGMKVQNITVTGTSNDKDGLGKTLTELKGASVYTSLLCWTPTKWLFPTDGYPQLQ